MRTCAVVMVTAVVAWTTSRLQSEAHAEAIAPPPVANEPAPAATSLPDIPRVRHVATATAETLGARNPFAYVSAPVVEQHVERAPVAVMVESPEPSAVVEVAAPREPEPPPFAYRYIGRFGPDARPLAAFSRDGEVVVRRAGERIDEQFMLTAIGVESVEVAAGDGTQRMVRRVALGQ